MSFFRFKTSSFVPALLALALPVLAAPAMAQQATPQEAPQVDQAKVDALIKELPEINWIKICGRDEEAGQNVCTIRARELVSNNQVLGVLQLIEVEGVPQKAIVLLPTGLQIPNGVRLQVDENTPVPGQFRICFPNNCLIEAKADKALIDSMKQGSELIITAQNQAGRPVPFKFSLSGFTKAVDGEPIDAQVFAAAEQQMREKAQAAAQENQSLQQALQKRAEEVSKQKQD
jgi:invasion protein IalB